MKQLITALLLVLPAAAQPHVESVRSLVRAYVKGFVHPSTGLAYGKRIDGPSGIGVLEGTAEVAQRKVAGELRPWGYGSGIEDLAYHNGMLLFALLDADQAAPDPFFAGEARRTFNGLRLMSRISKVPGFVPRGPHPADGKSYYPDSSRDQHSLYLCALWRWSKSRFASDEEKAWIREMAGLILRRIEKDGWSIKNEDSSADAHAGGSMLVKNATTSLLLLQMLGTAYDLTGDTHWKEAFDRFGAEESGVRWALLDKPPDRSRAFRYTMFMNQDMLRTETLRRIEKDPKRKSILARRLVNFADDMLTCNYFQAWRRVDWLGDEGWDAAKSEDVANAYLKPTGLTVQSPATVLDLVKLYDSERWSPETLRGRRNHYDPIMLATPAMVFQIALLSRKPEHVRAVRPAIQDLLRRTKFDNVTLGWGYNYAVLAALWSIADLQ